MDIPYCSDSLCESHIAHIDHYYYQSLLPIYQHYAIVNSYLQLNTHRDRQTTQFVAHVSGLAWIMHPIAHNRSTTTQSKTTTIEHSQPDTSMRKGHTAFTSLTQYRAFHDIALLTRSSTRHSTLCVKKKYKLEHYESTCLNWNVGVCVPSTWSLFDTGSFVVCTC